jgi:hypothetical protein
MCEIQRTSAMSFAQCADALQIAEGRRFHPDDFFGIEFKSSHAAQQKIRGFWTALGYGSQLRTRHAHVPRHALDFRLTAASEL